jgi:predicted transcriptional regulator
MIILTSLSTVVLRKIDILEIKMEHEHNQYHSDAVELAAEIVASYVAHNSVPASELAHLIHNVHSALTSLGQPVVAEVKHQEPAVPVKKSVTPDYIICLEDGKKFKSLKRHLRTKFEMGPEEYRAKWGLPSDYPMVSPNYAAARSNLALAMGLGQKRQANAGRKKGSKAAK